MMTLKNNIFTEIGRTLTDEGYIYHIKTAQGYDLPVKVILLQSVRAKKMLPRPKRKAGKLVFAVPGGAEFVESTTPA